MDSRGLLVDTMAYLAPAKTLEGLSAVDAQRRLAGAPHSIAEIVAHMAFWQDWFLQRAAGIAAPMVTHAAAGWPEPGDWDALRERFLAGLERLAELDVQAKITPAIEMPFMAEYTGADVVTHMATHSAHHLGQIILMRQMMGAWPPLAGSWTW